jgi:hypothetical protein
MFPLFVGSTAVCSLECSVSDLAMRHQSRITPDIEKGAAYHLA